MTTYYEYTSPNGDAQPDPASVKNGYTATLLFIDPECEGILRKDGNGDFTGDIYNTPETMGHFQWINQFVTAASWDDAIDALEVLALNYTPPQPGWLLVRYSIGAPLYVSLTQIGEVP